MPDCSSWTTALAALLRQGAELAAALPAEVLGEGAPLAPGGGVGAHLRHVGDFVQALLRDLDSGTIDYDRRERDERLERSPARARARLLALAQRVEHLAPRASATPLRVRAESALVGTEAQGSTLARELGTSIGHALHHYALVAVLLRARGLEPPPELGVAPSTLAHWREAEAVCAPRAG